ncbi:MAG TPA: hypothetical protein VHN99_11880 [Deinococcales bacterium]|nr:hypothetical protein [Deinococcales bacterium]
MAALAQPTDPTPTRYPSESSARYAAHEQGVKRLAALVFWAYQHGWPPTDPGPPATRIGEQVTGRPRRGGRIRHRDTWTIPTRERATIVTLNIDLCEYEWRDLLCRLPDATVHLLMDYVRRTPRTSPTGGPEARHNRVNPTPDLPYLRAPDLDESRVDGQLAAWIDAARLLGGQAFWVDVRPGPKNVTNRAEIRVMSGTI